MTELTTIVAVVIVGCAVFGAVWIITRDVKSSLTAYIEDVKKGVHARVDRSDHVIDEIVRDCSRKKENFITTGAFDRFEKNLNVRFNGFDDNIKHLTERVDDLIIATRNGSSS